VTHLACDLGQPDFLAEIGERLQATMEAAETVALVHNAARMDIDRAVDLNDAALHGVLEVNVVAPNALNRFCIPRMRAGSAIVYVGSTLSWKAVPGRFS